ncbi:MAG TPA: sugar phosphate isomerase/epimerase [Streptosporangiaceae bacterium]|nr:sugar phosphate isomerase/epimerase [Streptosporangiaceae bacterium]
MSGDLGIFARTFRRETAAQVAAAVQQAGFGLVQLNLSSFGLPTIPSDEVLAGLDLPGIRGVFADHGITIWGVSLTYNMIDPDAGRRARATAQARAFIGRIPELGAQVATLCTGTRDPADIWSGHPDNARDSAWRDLRASLAELLPGARTAGLRLGIEPERANVISSAGAARRLLDELGGDAALVGIVLDPANLVQPATANQQRDILTGAFTDLADEIVALHAKDVVESGYAAAGAGVLDYELIFRLRAALPRPVPVIVQDATEADSVRVREMLAGLLRRHPGPRDPGGPA